MDKIPAKFLRNGAEALAFPLTNMINLSIKLSTFPEWCKIAKLKPMFKKGTRTDPKNYRPISLLPLVSGFSTNHSTDFCLAQLTDFVSTGMEK